MSIHDSVRRTIRRHGLIQPGARVLVALSGGPDSVALLRVLSEISAPEGFQLAGLAHFNHQLRGVASDEDEAFCRTLAAGHSLPIDVERADVAELAREAGASIEHAAHDARLAFFERAAARLHAVSVAVAHTRNDQAETYLLRLLRGAGPRGLGGMHPRSGLVIRPFIDTTRDDVLHFLHAGQLSYRDDASNADLSIPRNRIRLELIPLLEARFSTNVVDVLDRGAAVAREDAEFLEAAAADVSRRLVVGRPDGVEISIAALLAEAPAVARRVLRAAQQAAAGGDRFIGFDAVEAVLALAVSKSKGPLDLPGHRVNRLGDTIVLTRRVGRGADNPQAGFSYGLDIPGQVSVPEGACTISADPQAVASGEVAGDRWPLVGRGNQVVAEAGVLTGPLVVRNRRPGDRFRPLGLQGRKTLQDFFVDAKVGRDERDSVPLVVDSKGRIVWVAGLSLAEEFRVTDRTKAVVILKRLPV
jgi:tRNA(Ile)-lysidine synthase